MSIYVDLDTILDKKNGCVIYSSLMAHLALRCQHTTEDEKITPLAWFLLVEQGMVEL